MQKDLVVVGGRRKSDLPTILLFGCAVHPDRIEADAYLVLRPLRKGSKPRLHDESGRVVIESGLKPGYIQFAPIELKRCS